MGICGTDTSALGNYIIVADVGHLPTGAARYSGVRVYQADTRQEKEWDGTGWTIMSEPTQTWTPTLAQGATSNIAKTVTRARYKRSDGWIQGSVQLTPTGAGTSGSIVSVSAPIAGNGVGAALLATGAGWYQDSGTAQYSVIVHLMTGSLFQFVRADTNSTNFFGSDPTMAIAAADILTFFFSYEMNTRYL